VIVREWAYPSSPSQVDWLTTNKQRLSFSFASVSLPRDFFSSFSRYFCCNVAFFQTAMSFQVWNPAFFRYPPPNSHLDRPLVDDPFPVLFNQHKFQQLPPPPPFPSYHTDSCTPPPNVVPNHHHLPNHESEIQVDLKPIFSIGHIPLEILHRTLFLPI